MLQKSAVVWVLDQTSCFFSKLADNLVHIMHSQHAVCVCSSREDVTNCRRDLRLRCFKSINQNLFVKM